MISRRRLIVSTLGSAAIITLLSLAVPGRQTVMCTDIDAPGPCVQLAAGFPFPYVVDHWLYSAGDNVSLIAALMGEDLLIWQNALASLIFWWVAAVAVVVALRR